MLNVEDVSAGYHTRKVLDGVSFSLAEGEIAVLVGPNGAGKTTLLKAISGALRTSGSLLLKGRKPESYSRREMARTVTVVAQENETRFPVRVIEYVLAGRFAHGDVFGWETEKDLAAAESAIRECGLEELAGRFMNHLSGGERQRAVLARSVAAEANLYLLDEPTANLDLSNQSMMFGIVRRRCMSGDTSAVVITHDLNLASEFADRLLVLKDGRVLAAGAPDEVLTEKTIREAFCVESLIDKNPRTGKTRITTIF